MDTLATEGGAAVEESRTLSLMVRQVRFEALGINSYELVRPDGGELPAASAGSHLDVHLPGGVIRQYSLCNDPADRGRYLIAVLKETAGRGGSRLLHDLLQVPNLVTVSLPRNNFALSAEARHSVLVAGGIGITPLKAMAHELASSGRSFELHYCTRTPQHAAFGDELAAFGAARVRLHHDGGDPARGLDLAGLLRDHAPGTHLYYCGPGGFMSACAAASAHWPAGSVHSEHFKAPAPLPSATTDEAGAAGDGTFIVELASSGLQVEVAPERSIVEALADAGVEIETSCVSGLCGTCKVRYLAGTVDHRDYVLSGEEQSEYLTACVSRAVRGRLVLDL